MALSDALDAGEEALLPDEKCEKNISSLRQLKGYSELLDSAISRESGFAYETRDLFYYFSGTGYLKALFRMPRLRERHDERLYAITQVLDVADLSTSSEDEHRAELSERTSKTRRELQKPIDIYNLTEAYLRNQMLIEDLDEDLPVLEFLKGLQGRLDTRELEEKNLKPHLQRFSFLRLDHPVIPLAGAFIYNYVAQPSILSGIIGGLISSRLLKRDIRDFAPVSYKTLSEKAKRMDLFLTIYGDSI